MLDDQAQRPPQFLRWDQLAEELLKDLDAGRTAAQDAQPIVEEYETSIRKQLAAAQNQNEKLVNNPAEAPEAHQLFVACMERTNALYKSVNTALEFIGTFQASLSRMLGRLPVKPEFEPYRQVFGELQISKFCAWRDPDSDLGVLEFRLREMLSTRDPQSSPAARPPGHWTTEQWSASLRTARRRFQITQKEAAERCHVDTETYRKWEQGNRPPADRNSQAVRDFIRSAPQEM